MKDFLYWIVYRLADIHTWIMQLNDGFEQSFTDKELHFIVIGVAGLALFLMIHPLIRALCKKGMEILVSLLYTLTLVVVVTFGIEVGQQVTNTGHMELADIVWGVAGFLAAFVVYLVVKAVVRWIWRRFH